MLTRFSRRHCGWQIDQPLRIDRKAAHHLKRGDGVLFTDRDLRLQSCVNQSLSRDICQIQNVILGVLRRAFHLRTSCRALRKKGSRRLVVRAMCCDRDRLSLWIAQCGELAAEDAPLYPGSACC